MPQTVTRHYLTIPASGETGSRRVHYRRCGTGPVLLMVHQSPRSGGEYVDLMHRWGEHFTCIAPDSPGFGQSDPLSAGATMADFADAIAEFVRALGIEKCAAYGFHSGGIFLVTALKRHRDLFSCLAVGGYAIWTEEEERIFADSYLAPFVPSAYGEHLTWVWNRILEQSWFFPWFDVRPATRLPKPHSDLAIVHGAVMDLIASGDNYRIGYGAALSRADDTLGPGEVSPPVLITAYDGDPLQAHLGRLGPLADSWEARAVPTPEAQQEETLDFLRKHGTGSDCGDLPEDSDEGWLTIGEGQVHWSGDRSVTRLTLHAPGHEAAPAPGQLAIDVPGHGLSDDLADMESAIALAAAELGAEIDWPAPPVGDPDFLYPDLAPDRFGGHLTRAWSAARAGLFFEPWYLADRDHAVDFAADDIAPENIMRLARARLRAGDAAARYHALLAEKGAD